MTVVYRQESIEPSANLRALIDDANRRTDAALAELHALRADARLGAAEAKLSAANAAVDAIVSAEATRVEDERDFSRRMKPNYGIVQDKGVSRSPMNWGRGYVRAQGGSSSAALARPAAYIGGGGEGTHINPDAEGAQKRMVARQKAAAMQPRKNQKAGRDVPAKDNGAAAVDNRRAQRATPSPFAGR